MRRCDICGTEIQDGAHRFCGGDRCLRVFMRPRRTEPPLMTAWALSASISSMDENTQQCVCALPPHAAAERQDSARALHQRILALMRKCHRLREQSGALMRQGENARKRSRARSASQI